MNWYLKTIFAQGLQGFLQSIGISPEIIQYISSADKDIQPLLVNAIKKNPRLTISDLQQIQPKQKIDPYLPSEKKDAARYPDISQWILVSYRKIRKGKLPPPNFENIPWEQRSTMPYLEKDEAEQYVNFSAMLPEIYDWYRNVHPDIASYSPQEAAVETQEWHKMMAGKGSGKMYEPTKQELIMYGPQWENPEWNGWTIQKVVSKNDLLTEGNKQNHCVGSYCDYVERGESTIYSLRDPANNPKVTMETDNKHQMVQIQGNSNRDPEKVYREMIKEWLSSQKNPGIIGYADTVDDPLDWDYNDHGLELINDYNIIDEYGLERESYSTPEDLAKRALDIESKSRNPYYGGSLTDIPYAIIDMIVRINQQKKFRNKKEQRENLAKQISDFENYLTNIEQDFMEDVYTYWNTGEDYPQEENFETTEEYEAAVEEYQKNEDEYISDEIKKTPVGGFVHDAFEYIQQLRKKKVLPPYKPQKPKNKVVASWYKKIVLSSSRMLSVRDFLNELKDYGIIVERYGDGSRSILLNTKTNKRTNFHYHRGRDVGLGTIRNVLRDLGIDYWDFMNRDKKKPITDFPVVPDIDPDAEIDKTPDYKKQPWYLRQQRLLSDEGVST